MDPSFGLPLWPVLTGLLLAACFLSKDWRCVASSGVLLAVWVLCTFAAPVSPSDAYGMLEWPLWALYDGCAAAFLIWQARRPVMLVIAGTYVFELAAHFAYGLADMLAGTAGLNGQLAYWQTTHWGAWVQAWLLLAWIGRDGLGRLVGAWRDRARHGRADDLAWAEMHNGRDDQMAGAEGVTR